jgi:hypothetical protein
MLRPGFAGPRPAGTCFKSWACASLPASTRLRRDLRLSLVTHPRPGRDPRDLGPSRARQSPPQATLRGLHGRAAPGQPRSLQGTANSGPDLPACWLCERATVRLCERPVSTWPGRRGLVLFSVVMRGTPGLQAREESHRFKPGGSTVLGGEFLAERAGGDALEGADEPGQGDLRRVADEEVDVVGFAVELAEFRAEVPHDLLAAGQGLSGERAAPVLRREDQVCMEVIATLLPLRIPVFRSRRGVVGRRYGRWCEDRGAGEAPAGRR